jgi:polyferredoxin
MPYFTGDNIMKKELTIFIGLFLFLAIGMHFKEWISHPIDHIMALPTAGAYGIGPFHPLIFTTALYLVIAFFRGIGSVFAKK